jgi:hypothetical protein
MIAPGGKPLPEIISAFYRLPGQPDVVDRRRDGAFEAVIA